MKRTLGGLLCLIGALGFLFETRNATGLPAAPPPLQEPAAPSESEEIEFEGKVYVLPIRENIMPPLVYLVRRGVKEAMEAEADVLVIDMETDGGRVDVTEEIIEIINRFPGRTITYVNRRAFSAGAFISFATQQIYMAPQSVIGAAAPVMMSPTGGPGDMPSTMDAKISSALAALVRANAEKNGHNPEIADAMVRKTELIIDGKVLNEKGQILTLTNVEAEQMHGDPPRPLLSLATIASLDDLLETIGHANAERVHIQATGAERLGFYINAVSPLLLMIGIIGLYIEFKTPGFGFFGIAGVTAFAIYFLGAHVAGLSGMTWIVVFILGLALIAVELFIVPGTLVAGVLGAGLILVSLIMATVDHYPGMPALPELNQLQAPVQDLIIAMVGSIIFALALSRFLPKSSVYRGMVSHTASGVESVRLQSERLESRQGALGVTVSPLRPGGKARFGDEILDVVSQGEMIDRGAQVRVVGHRGSEPIVEAVT